MNLTDNILYRTVASCNTENHFTPFSYFSISFLVQNVCSQIGQEDKKLAVFTAWKVSKYGVFLAVFSRIWTEYRDLLNTEIYSVNLRIQSKYGKIKISKALYLDNFNAVIVLSVSMSYSLRLKEYIFDFRGRKKQKHANEKRN